MDREEDATFTASWIWKAPTLPRIKSFLWQCAHNSIAVKDCLTRRGVVEDGKCPICNREVETILHALRDCPRVHLVWRQIGVQLSNYEFWNSNLTNWLNLNGRMNTNQPAGKPPWKILFPFAIWNIWKYRNDFVFNRKMQNLNLVADIQNIAVEFMYCVSHPRVLPCRFIKRVSWEKPPLGWAKLNTNGAAVGRSGLARCGGLIRDDKGAWLAGFSRNIGSTSSYAAELWGIRDGLTLCCNMNIHSIIVELDAKSIVDVFGNPNFEGNIISPIMDDCKQLMLQFHQIQFKHCYREVNRCADMLAKVGLDQNSCLVYFDSPPEIIRTILGEDCNGFTVDRICSVVDVVS